MWKHKERGCQNWPELAYSNKTSVYLWNISVIQKYLENKRINTCVVYPASDIKHYTPLLQSTSLSLLRNHQHSECDIYPPHAFLHTLLYTCVPINIWYSSEDFNFTRMCHTAYHLTNCMCNLTLSLRFIICSLSLDRISLVV